MYVLDENAKNSEESEQIFLVGVLNLLLPNKFHHSPNGGWRHINTATRFKRLGVSPGFPDIIIIGSPYYKDIKIPGCVVELKSKTGRPFEAQREWIDQFVKAGFPAKICSGAVNALNFILDNGYLPKEGLDAVMNRNREIVDENNRAATEGKFLGKKQGRKSILRDTTRDRKGYIELYNRMVREPRQQSFLTLFGGKK